MWFRVESQPGEGGRWLAEVLEPPGVLAYGQSESEARVKVLALRVVAEQFDHGESGPELRTVSFAAA